MSASLPTGHAPEGYIKLPGSERHPSKEATFLRPADDNEIIQIAIVLRRRTDGPAMPDFDHYANTPPNKREKLTPEDFAGKYGAHPEDIRQVVTFTKTSGLTVLSTDAATRTVQISGTVARVSKVFAVPLGQFEVTTGDSRKQKAPPKKEIYRGRDGFIYVPAAIAPLLIGVFGLDNRNVARRATQYADPIITTPIKISQITDLYKFPAPTAAISHQTIGIVALAGGYALPDLQAYFDSIGMNLPAIHQVSVDGSEGALTLRSTNGLYAWERTLRFTSTEGIEVNDVGSIAVGGAAYYFKVVAMNATSITVDVWSQEIPGISMWAYHETGFGVDVPAETWVYFNVDAEVTQDICIAASAARGAAITVYYAQGTQSGWLALMYRALSFEQGGFRHPNFSRPSVISSSFGTPGGDDFAGLAESGFSPAFLTAMDMTFQDAAALKITVCNASGDRGSLSSIWDGYAHVSFPASDPWVLAVGGTTIGKDQQRRPHLEQEWEEYVWNEIVDDFDEYATGGGVSAFFPLPSYQKNASVPDSINPTGILFPVKTGRGVPDVAANASLFGGYQIMVAGLPFIANGTSAATPLWAALIAIINANLGHNVGFINPFLYTLGADAFNPINPLSRNPVYPQLADCPANNGINGQRGYPSGPGWDACTGWGSPNGTALLNAFKGM